MNCARPFVTDGNLDITKLNIGGALSWLASQQEASQENWVNLLNSTKVLAKSWYRGQLFQLFVYFIFPITEIIRLTFDTIIDTSYLT